jgi:crotonobetainyl-CoA:carnitine CoA-transferase CaiB-like acyl-CoA transferase
MTNKGGSTMQSAGPLDGIRILDFTHVLSGPFGTSLLGDLGAEIIKVEPPAGDRVRTMGPPFQGGESAYFFCVNRNKKSISLDLKKPEAIDVVRRLVKDCDVIVENYRPGVMDRLGLGYDEITKIKPDIIYSSMTAFGKKGPYKDKPGFELIIQALSGLVDVTTPPEGTPAKIQIQVVDLCTGMFLAFGTLAALYHKLATGQGQKVDTSLLESTLAMMANLAGIYFMTGKVPTGMGSRNPQAFPSQAFKSKDGYFVMVGHWDRFCRALGKPEWIDDPQLGSNAYRVEHYDDMTALVESVTTTRTTAEWLKVLQEHQVAAGPINTVEDAFEDPGVQATGIVKTMEHPQAGKIKLLDKPWHLSASTGGLRLPPPAFGQHTDEVLLAHGFSESEIALLKQHEAVFGP